VRLKLYRTVGWCLAAWWQALLGCIQTRPKVYGWVLFSVHCSKAKLLLLLCQGSHPSATASLDCFKCTFTVWRRLQVPQGWSCPHDRKITPVFAVRASSCDEWPDRGSLTRNMRCMNHCMRGVRGPQPRRQVAASTVSRQQVEFPAPTRGCDPWCSQRKHVIKDLLQRHTQLNEPDRPAFAMVHFYGPENCTLRVSLNMQIL
jgi:hypothetical protein